MDSIVISKIDNGIGELILNDPDTKNSLSKRMFTELRRVIEELDENDSVRVIIITGTGDSFSSGVNLKERLSMSDRESEELRSKIVLPFYQYMSAVKKPIIAAINGYAVGGGFELALGADIIIASENAKFGQREVKWGIIPAGGALRKLPQIIGILKTKELVFTGRIIDANEAYKIGLVNMVVPKDKLMEKAREIASEIGENSISAVAMAKRFLNAMQDQNILSVLEIEASNICYSSEDRKEGIRAFSEKRKPVYK
jgi:enoyl-CoA hydratase/carnithine racemase